MKKSLFLTIPFLGFLSFLACSSDTNASVDTSETPISTPTTTVPDVYKKIYGATSITTDGTYVTIKTNGQPDHKSVCNYSGCNKAIILKASKTFCPFLTQVSVTDRMTA